MLGPGSLVQKADEKSVETQHLPLPPARAEELAARHQAQAGAYKAQLRRWEAAAGLNETAPNYPTPPCHPFTPRSPPFSLCHLISLSLLATPHCFRADLNLLAAGAIRARRLLPPPPPPPRVPVSESLPPPAIASRRESELQRSRPRTALHSCLRFHAG